MLSTSSTLVYIHELVVKLDNSQASVGQLVRALHRNRRAAGSIPVRDLKIAFFPSVSG